MSLNGPAAFAHLLQRQPRGFQTDVERQDTNGTDDQIPVSQRENRRDTNSNSRFSRISRGISSFRDRQNERNQNAERANAEVQRIVAELNRRRNANDGDQIARNGDLEAQLPNAGNTGTINSTSAPLSMRKITGKSRREREEGATLFGPNLANYFGSGSSTSGAIAGALVSQPSNSVGTSGLTSNAIIGSPSNVETMQRRPRLGSRGRARGASLSGLSQYSLNNLDAIDSVPSLADPALMSQASISQMDARPGELDGNDIPMAEGIELGTLRRWIERSTVGGTVEVSNAEEVANLRGNPGNPSTMCSTLQSYVNLKRNTIKLHALPHEKSQSLSASFEDPLQRSLAPNHQPLATHSISFDYDCAAPFASVQVFVRASRKHGSWVTWTTARESAGLPIDLTIGAEDDGESRFLGQRGPPPHVLGWPVFVTRARKGFSVPLSVQVALRLELYAPPKLQSAQDFTALPKPPAPIASPIPETPAIDVSRRLDEPETPAISAPAFDPLSLMRSNETGQLPSALPGVAAAVSGVNDQQNTQTESSTNAVIETKEEKAARERAERETLKIAVVVEALDEDGKPLREPNLQTTYMRIASLPIRSTSEGKVEIVDVDGGAVQEADDAGIIHDVALPPLTPLSPTQGNIDTVKSTSNNSRAWSVQVEGQEAEIGPHRFQLQELYGLSSRPPPPQQQQHNDENNQEGVDGEDQGMTGETPLPQLDLMDNEGNASECLICLSAPPTTLLLPCTHGLCLDCAVQLRDTVKATRESERRRGRRPKRKYACPVCRRVYSSMLHLSAVDEKYLAQSATAS